MIITRKTSINKLNSLEELYSQLMNEIKEDKENYGWELQITKSPEYWIIKSWDKTYFLWLKYVKDKSWQSYSYLFWLKTPNKLGDSTYNLLKQWAKVKTLDLLKESVNWFLKTSNLLSQLEWIELWLEDNFNSIKSTIQENLKEFRDDYWSRADDTSRVVELIEQINKTFKNDATKRKELLNELIYSYKEICETSKERDINDENAWEDL